MGQPIHYQDKVKLEKTCNPVFCLFVIFQSPLSEASGLDPIILDLRLFDARGKNVPKDIFSQMLMVKTGDASIPMGIEFRQTSP